MQCPVSQSVDGVFVLPTSMSMHDYMPAGPTPPLPPPSPIGVAFEIPTFVYWPPGALRGKNKLTESVKHNEFSFAQDSHDCGPLIVHMQIAPSPTNAMTPVHLIKSKRKAMFSAGEVKADKKPVAHMILANMPPTPMKTCGSPLGLPSSCSTTSWKNNLIISVHVVDLIAGWAAIVVSLCFDWAKSKTPSGAQSAQGQLASWAGTAIGGWMSDLTGNPFGGLVGGTPNSASGAFGEKAQDNTTSFVTGLIRLSGQLLGDYHGDAGIQISAGDDAYEVAVGFEHSGEDGGLEVTASEQVSGPFGVLQAQAQEGVSFGGDSPTDGTIGGSVAAGGLDADGSQSVNEGFSAAQGWGSL